MTRFLNKIINLFSYKKKSGLNIIISYLLKEEIKFELIDSIIYVFLDPKSDNIDYSISYRDNKYYLESDKYSYEFLFQSTLIKKLSEVRLWRLLQQ
jgi:hypothetical protein